VCRTGFCRASRVDVLQSSGNLLFRIVPFHASGWQESRNLRRDPAISKPLDAKARCPRECLAPEGDRPIAAGAALAIPMSLRMARGMPRHVRRDNGLRFMAEPIRGCSQRVSVEDIARRASESLRNRQLTRVLQHVARRAAEAIEDNSGHGSGASLRSPARSVQDTRESSRKSRHPAAFPTWRGSNESRGTRGVLSVGRSEKADENRLCPVNRITRS